MRANASFLYLGKIVIFRTFHITAHIKTCVVIFTNIRTAGKIIHSFKGTVIQKRKITVQINGSDVSRIESALFCNNCRMNVIS